MDKKTIENKKTTTVKASTAKASKPEKIKKEKKIKFGKLPGIFKKKYTEKKLNKKILKLLRIPTDRKFVEGLFKKSEIPSGKKTKILFSIPEPKCVPADVCKRLKNLAKDIKKQGKSRIKLVNIAVVLAVFIGVFFVIGLFRNYIARIALTSAMQGIFGAKCDIEYIDFDIFNTRFTVEGLQVADKNEPMKNLFEVGRFDLYFNLLELTRGKLVSENIELTGITWGTDRETSGALPEKKQKKLEDKKASSGFSFKETTSAVATAVNADQGLAAVMNLYDPQKIIEAEINSLQTPPIVETIKKDVPVLVEKWKGQYDSVMEMTETTAADVKTISSINFNDINSSEEALKLVAELKEIGDRSKDTVEKTKKLVTSLEDDKEKITQLTSSAQQAVKNDTDHLISIADKIADFDLDTGKNLVSGIVETFIRGMLGDYYPYVQRGITVLRGMQNSSDKEKAKKEREFSIEERASLLERLPGKNFAFGKSAPTLWLKNIALSCNTADSSFSGSGKVTNITSDADRLDEASGVMLAVAKDAFKTDINGLIDFRTTAPEIADIGFSVDGTEISIPSGGVQGVPSLDSPAQISGTLVVSSDGTTNIDASMGFSSADFELEAFEPDFLYNLYNNVLSDIKKFSVGMDAVVTPSLNLDLSVSSDVDNAIAESVKKQAAGYVAEIRDSVKQKAEEYIAGLKEQYSTEIEAFTSSISVIQERFSSVEDIESMIDSKIEEAEARAKELAAQKATEAISPLTDSLENIMKKDSGSSSGDSSSGEESKPKAADSIREGLKKFF